VALAGPPTIAREKAAMALEIEEVQAVWREAERALEVLPPDAPERPVILMQVARLRRSYIRLTHGAGPASWQLIESTREAIDQTKRALAEARSRIDAPSTLTETERLMEAWLLAEQALNRADDDPARRADLLRIADEARERYQAAIDSLDPDLAG
jgi:hypothetical protein